METSENLDLPGSMIQVANSLGQIILRQTITTDPGVITISGNPGGLYTVRVSGKYGIRTARILLK